MSVIRGRTYHIYGDARNIRGFNYMYHKCIGMNLSHKIIIHIPLGMCLKAAIEHALGKLNAYLQIQS